VGRRACRVQCLKYLVLASMLMESTVDPFNAQETKPYRADPQIEAMTNLVEVRALSASAFALLRLVRC
jgi:hypothetical protein